MPSTIASSAGNIASELPDDVIQVLQQRVRGPLLRPPDAGFEDATRPWNGMIDKTPALVVQPTGNADVVAAVNFAREQSVALSVRGGGHNIAGTSLIDAGLTVDLSRLRGILVDPEAMTATVQAGCRLGDVDRETQLHGLATPLGFISEVGVSGLTLGGGLGYLTRRFGWTVDNLLEVDIVTADGRLRRASDDENEDLFWAVRGAGANLGVVTSLTYRLHRVGPMVYGGLIVWPFERAEEIMRAYRTITTEAPRELAVWLVLMRAPAAPFVPPELHGKQSCAMAVCYSGDLADADDVLEPIRSLGTPVLNLLAERPYAQVQSFLDQAEPKGMHYYWRTEFLAELTDDVLAQAYALFAECPMPLADIGFLHLGGKLNEHAWDDGAVGNRDARFALGVKGEWAPGEAEADRFREWVRDAGARVRPYSTGATYINFQTADEGEDRIRATYGRNLDRLVAVKQKYDPDNMFRSNRNIRASLVR